MGRGYLRQVPLGGLGAVARKDFESQLDLSFTADWLSLDWAKIAEAGPRESEQGLLPVS